MIPTTYIISICEYKKSEKNEHDQQYFIPNLIKGVFFSGGKKLNSKRMFITNSVGLELDNKNVPLPSQHFTVL